MAPRKAPEPDSSRGQVRPGAAGSPAPASVAVINYNGRSYLQELLGSLELQTRRPLETLLVDNASRDGSLAYVEREFPWIRVLPQERNLGFSRAANLAAGEARGTWLALLNTDLRLEPDWLAELVAGGEADPSIAAVSSKLRLYDRPHRLNGVGGCMNRLGYTWDRGMGEEDRGQYDESREVLFACAGAALFHRSRFREAGGFDPRFFMYHEDVDLCWRLWLRGYRVVTAPRAVAYHHLSASTRKDRGLLWREILGERHNMRSLLKNYEGANLVRALWGLLTLRQPARRKWAQLGNLAWNLRWLPETLRLRRRIRKERRVTDAQLKRLIVQSRHVPIPR